MTTEQDGTWFGLIVPYRGHLKEPIKPGQTLIIQGLTSKDSQRFTINLHNKSADFSGNDIPFHISVRFDEGKIVFNTFTANQWGKEERKKSPIKKGENFDIRVRVFEKNFHVFINRKPFLEYEFRLPLTDITHFSVDGDLFLSKIHWSGKYYTVPHETGIPSGFVPGKKLLIFGQVLKKAKEFEINFLHKSGDIALHIKPKFGDKAIVRNAHTLGEWGKEERDGKFVFEKGSLFDLFIENTKESFKIFINGQYYCDFIHRLGAHEIHGLQIKGDVDIIGIQMETVNDIDENEQPPGTSSEIIEKSDVVAEINDHPTQDVQMEGLLTRSMKTFGHGIDRLPYHSLFGHIVKDSDAFEFDRFFKRQFCHLNHQLFDMDCHEFRKIDPKTGKINNCVKGNKIFHFGGRDNQLGDFGMIFLDNMISGRYRKKIYPYVRPKFVPKKKPIETGKPERSTPDGRVNVPKSYSPTQSPVLVKKEVPPVSVVSSPYIDKRQECLNEKKLFEDSEFPANDSSLYFTRASPKSIKWLRPGEIVKDPQLIVQGGSRFDVVQGELGDCWLLAGVACLTLRDELFYRVVPPDQSFIENYAGIFRFNFWRYRKWVEVIIDDRLPTYNGELIFLHSDSKFEFWSALLEKAYAKLFGSYEALDGGMTSEALEDFTGGLIEFYGTNEKPPDDLMGLIMKGFEKGSLFACSIDVQGPKGETVLIRMRNPWGNANEWKGAWSDGSWEWSTLSANEREQMKVQFLNDGEFWMAFDDFLNEFKKIEICHFSPEIMAELNEMTGIEVKADEVWASYEGNGEWSKNLGTAAGCRNFIATFANNPQFFSNITVDRNGVDSDGKVAIIAAVMQKYRREGLKNGLENLAIGYGVYKSDGLNATKKYDRRFFQTNKVIANTTFTNLREVTLQFRAPPGNYVIVPSTFEPNQNGEFLLRIYSEGNLRAG